MSLTSESIVIPTHMEEVFHGNARMLQSDVLDQMSRLLFDMFVDSIDVSIPGKRRSISHSGCFKLGYNLSSKGRKTRSPSNQGRMTCAPKVVGMTTTTKGQSWTKRTHHPRINDPQQRCVTLNPKS